MTQVLRAPLHCPKCAFELEAANWHGPERGRCGVCRTTFEFTGFPALIVETPAAEEAIQEALPEEAVCFYHGESRAESVCDQCGRFLCPVCVIDHGGRKVCASCIEHGQKKAPDQDTSRFMWDYLAMFLAVLPLLLWPFTAITAPASLGVAIAGWNKPGSLVRGKRLRLVIAMILSSLQIIGWGVLIVMFILNKNTSP